MQCTQNLLIDAEFTPFVGSGTCTFIPLSDRWIFNMPAREQRRPPASSPIFMHENTSSESSASLSALSPLVSGTDPIVTIPASPTTDLNISDVDLSSPDDSKQGVAGNSEQLDYPSIPMTPGKEKIMRICEDGVSLRDQEVSKEGDSVSDQRYL